MNTTSLALVMNHEQSELNRIYPSRYDKYYYFKIDKYHIYVLHPSEYPGHVKNAVLDVGVYVEREHCEGLSSEEWRQRASELAEPFRRMDMVMRPKTESMREGQSAPWWYMAGSYEFLPNVYNTNDYLHQNSVRSRILDRTRCPPVHMTESIHQVPMPPVTTHYTDNNSVCRKPVCERMD